jgi:DNA polymerase III subunit gamma/tau
MSYQVLARKYRPQKFSEVIGQEHVTHTLKNAIEQGRTAHGYIFSGHRGIGKTTVARILAMALNCRSTDHPVPEPCGLCESCTEIRAGNSVDVIEIDAATNRGIDEIRELREAARYRPARDRYKIYILDEAHQITDAAFNALLKTLEEPPGHVVFMLATTQPEDIPQTIRSRCQHFSFRAVRFEQILQQLKDLASKENIQADDDALALLAEAGDGSMRDALSIMDQAIASSDGRLTADAVRQLVGAVTSSILEEVMEAVSRASSEDVLRLLDKLISEGHNPVHFARQMVRFLRNTVVAKVAGRDSSLLQISSDERSRVTRVAQLFSEEDLARHLQIMLRTHSELGYRQEQRFHLELGLLKMAHAQRLLPLEQLLSDAAGQVGASPRAQVSAPGRSTVEPRRATSEGSTGARPNYVSPFAADSARKGTPKAEVAGDTMPSAGPRLVSSTATSPSVVMGATAPAPAVIAEPELTSQPEATDSGPETPQVASATDSSDRTASLRDAVITAIANTGQRMLASMIESGEWRLDGNEIVIKVAASATVIDMSFSNEAKRLIIAAASGVLGRPARLKVLPGGVPQTVQATSGSNGSGRGRAEQEPIVRRMKEKFGAEIRTIIDYRDKR